MHKANIYGMFSKTAVMKFALIRIRGEPSLLWFHNWKKKSYCKFFKSPTNKNVIYKACCPKDSKSLVSQAPNSWQYPLINYIVANALVFFLFYTVLCLSLTSFLHYTIPYPPIQNLVKWQKPTKNLFYFSNWLITLKYACSSLTNFISN